MAKVRFGIIGCGSAAVPVCRAIAESAVATLAMTQDTSAELARDLGEQYGVPHTTELGELLERADVDAVYIAVPHDLLAPLAKRALDAGKHALVEKPMALTLRALDELIATAADKGLTLGTFYEMRYAPGFARARALVQQGAIGRIIGVQIETLIDKPQSYWHAGYNARSRNSWRGERARAGGGVVLMNVSHFLDALWYVTGLNVTAVQGLTSTLASGVEVEDTAAAVLRLDNGAVGSLFAGAHLAGASGDETFTLYGTDGTLHVPDPYHQTPLRVYLRRSWNDLAGETWHTLETPRVNVHACAIDDFASAARQGKPAPISGEDARRVLQVVLGVYESTNQASLPDHS